MQFLFVKIIVIITIIVTNKQSQTDFNIWLTTNEWMKMYNNYIQNNFSMNSQLGIVLKIVETKKPTI